LLYGRACKTVLSAQSISQKEIGKPLSARACEIQWTVCPRGRARISPVDDTTEMMLISQFGKIILIDTKHIEPPGRTSGVKLLNLDEGDKVAPPP